MHKNKVNNQIMPPEEIFRKVSWRSCAKLRKAFSSISIFLGKEAPLESDSHFNDEMETCGNDYLILQIHHPVGRKHERYTVGRLTVEIDILVSVIQE